MINFLSKKSQFGSHYKLIQFYILFISQIKKKTKKTFYRIFAGNLKLVNHLKLKNLDIDLYPQSHNSFPFSLYFFVTFHQPITYIRSIFRVKIKDFNKSKNY